MSLAWVLRFCAFMIHAVSASPLTTAENPLVRTSPTSDVSHLTSFSNLSVVSFNATSGNALKIKCDGARYGENLNIADCKDAKRYIGSGSKQVPWVGRHTAFEKAHFALPYRYMGDRGHCYIQIDLAEGYPLAYASHYEVQSAANAVILKCAAGDTLQGGSVSNIGADDGLVMVLGTYEAAVECRGTFAPTSSCATILDDMETTQSSETFGPKGDPAPQVLLPKVLKSRDGKSSVRVFGTSDTTSWYQIWEAVMLVYSVCARKGKAGSVRGLGDRGNLFLTMTAETGSLSIYARAEVDDFD